MHGLSYNEYPRVVESRKICRDLNLENELNSLKLLKQILTSTLRELGISSPQSVSNAFLIDGLGRMVLRFARKGKINSKKVLSLVTKFHEQQTITILGLAAVGLMERYGLIIGGPRIF